MYFELADCLLFHSWTACTHSCYLGIVCKREPCRGNGTSIWTTCISLTPNRIGDIIYVIGITDGRSHVNRFGISIGIVVVKLTVVVTRCTGTGVLPKTCFVELHRPMIRCRLRSFKIKIIEFDCTIIAITNKWENINHIKICNFSGLAITHIHKEKDIFRICCAFTLGRIGRILFGAFNDVDRRRHINSQTYFRLALGNR